MTPPSSTQVLREEHQVILRVLAVLERLLASSDNQPLDFDDVERCATFFKQFADACHHGKEEDLLFPELEGRGVPREGGPIGVMLYEHQQGRALVKQMRENLPAARNGDSGATQALTDAGRAFIELLRNHIAKEDNILFMMADRLVDEASCEKLCGEYAHVCSRQFDGVTKQQLEQLAAELAARYDS